MRFVLFLPPVPSPADAACLRALRGHAGLAAMAAAPHLYYLAPDHAAWTTLAAGEEPLVAAASLYPRAAAAVARAFGWPDGRPAHWLDRRAWPDPAALAAAMLDAARRLEAEATAAGRGTGGGGDCARSATPPIPGTPGRAGGGADGTEGEAAAFAPLPPRWYPVVDVARCGGCGACAAFCLWAVYDHEADGRARVARPDACRPGCPACARICPDGAILFPHCPDDAGIAGDPDAPIAGGASPEAARAAARTTVARYRAGASPAWRTAASRGTGDGGVPPARAALERLAEDLERREASRDA